MLQLPAQPWWPLLVVLLLSFLVHHGESSERLQPSDFCVDVDYAKEEILLEVLVVRLLLDQGLLREPPVWQLAP